jgi:hypothetical protein
MDRAQKAALASAGIGLIVLALKFGAYWLTGSLALRERPVGEPMLDDQSGSELSNAAPVALSPQASRAAPVARGRHHRLQIRP